ncbi:MAG: serine/threonine protein kinase, partial [Myxococcota bacterium]
MNGERPEQAVEPRPWAGRYLLEQPLGEGGMAVVWRAWDRRLKAWRAIKILRSRYTQPTKTRHRFELEAQTMARLSHSNIVTVHDIGEEDGQLFIVMEWLPGGSLQDRIQRDGPLTAQQTVAAGISILSALQAAHEAGIVHRDVKPSNILLDAEGESFLTD